MAVFRVERNKDYTVMSNHHLRNRELTLKAKGLLSQMLSLPENWDYTLAGLSRINRESIDAIRTAVWELEKAGYITRRQGRDRRGKMTAIEYTIYEQPQDSSCPVSENPTSDEPILENPTPGKPILENPTPEKPTTENPMQLNKERINTEIKIKEKINTDLQKNHSLPISFPNGSSFDKEWEKNSAMSAVEVCRDIIKDNIDYDILIQDSDLKKSRIDEIVELMLETICTRRKVLRIAGDDYPAEFVKGRFMKLNSDHIRFAFDCMRENTTKVRNMKQQMV